MMHFDRQRWKLLSDLLDGALERPSKDQESWLRKVCGDDEELLKEAKALLRAATDERSPLEIPLSEHAPELLESFLRDRLQGKILGSYCLAEEIGRGGMGVVYAAERCDGHFDQKVVVKLLATGMDSPMALRRFYMERQILAGLDHPHIAHLIDGGVTDDGRPYFVMERVDGEPIDLYCDRHALGIRDRIRLFLGVVEAIQYAHRHLIVHRDIKPSNVLVTDEGRVKLLDFGVAKLVGPDSERSAIQLTQQSRLLLTPEYASPEQLRSEAITTASDIYQLGALLYVLATGRVPHELTTHSPEEVVRMVCDGRIDRPSAIVTRSISGSIFLARGKTTPKRLRRVLRGDLDRIILKALQKEPERRYASAVQLAEDLRRYLRGDPVIAHGDSWPYRMGKFVGRHRWGFVAGIAAIVLALGSGVYHTLRITAERDVARREAMQRTEITQFLLELFQLPQSPELRGRNVTADELLQQGIERIRVESENRPDTRTRLLGVVGQASTRLGLFDQARPVLTEALELSRATFGDDSIETAEAAFRLGLLYEEERTHSLATPLLEEAMAIRRKRLDEDDPLLAETLGVVARNHREIGRSDRGEAEIREAIALLERSKKAKEEDLIQAQGSLAYILRATDRHDEAEELYRKIIAQRRESPADENESLASTLNNLAYLLSLNGQYGEAVDLYCESLEVHDKIFGPTHPRGLMIRANLAGVLKSSGRLKEAEEVLRSRLELTIESQSEGHWRVGHAHQGLGRILFDEGHFAEAEGEFLQAESIWSSAMPAGHPWTAIAQAERAACLFFLGRLRESEKLYRSSSPLLQSEEAIGNRSLLSGIERLVGFYEAKRSPARLTFYRGLLKQMEGAVAKKNQS